MVNAEGEKRKKKKETLTCENSCVVGDKLWNNRHSIRPRSKSNFSGVAAVTRIEMFPWPARVYTRWDPRTSNRSKGVRLSKVQLFPRVSWKRTKLLRRRFIPADTQWWLPRRQISRFSPLHFKKSDSMRAKISLRFVNCDVTCPFTSFEMRF